MQPQIVTIAALLSCSSVALGAFAAHALEAQFGPREVALWDTAIQYLQFHALALLILGLSSHFKLSSVVKIFFLSGIILFCGSLFAMALGAPRFFGMITPLGGLCFLISWILTAMSAYRQNYLNIEDNS